jgi:hypothetical protein
MWNRLSAILCASILCSGLASAPAQAAETRIDAFNLLCDGSVKNIFFNATGFAASANRFIQGGALTVFQPRGGINTLRMQVAGNPKKTVLIMGFHQTSVRADLTGFIPVTTSASGVVPMQLIGSCTGPGTAQGHAIVYFF